MPTTRRRGSAASVMSSAASSRHGTHHDAHTLSTVTWPLKSALSRPGTPLPSRSRPASGGRSVRGAGCPIKADGMREGSPAPSRSTNSAASARKATSGMNTIIRRRRTPASLSTTFFSANFVSIKLTIYPHSRAPSGVKSPALRRCPACGSNAGGRTRSTRPVPPRSRSRRHRPSRLTPHVDRDSWSWYRPRVGPHHHHGANSPPHDLVAHGGQMQRQEQQGEGNEHDDQRYEDGGMDRRSAQAEHRGRLVQRVPPIHRELDDGDVDRADEREDR